jgi:uncharacterized protein YwqG
VTVMELVLPTTHQHLTLPDTPESLKERKGWILSSVRPAWLLRASDSQKVQPLESFLGGDSPYRAEGQPWPSCPHCKRELGFVMQVMLTQEVVENIPNMKPGTFQFWNCWYCVPKGDAYADARELQTFDTDFLPFGASRSIVRWFEDQNLGFGPPHKSEQNLPFLKVLTPEPFLSLPAYFDERFQVEEWSEDELSDYDDAFMDALNSETISQVGGYPSWIQDGVQPKNPAADKNAEFVIALGTGDTDVFWGDTGFYYFFAADGDLAEPFVLEQTR